MPNKILLKKNSTATVEPSVAQLDFGELALNYGDGKLFYKNAAGAIKAIGNVSSVSVVSANGFAGTVATASTTPAITISTSITGILKGNGTSISSATVGTDYAAPGTSTTFTTAQSFTASGILLKGSSTGYTTFASANASATAYTITFPASTGTVLTTAAAVTVAQGGTGLATIPATSLLVANALNTLVSLAPAAGQSIRINSGGTLWEAYTPLTGTVTSVSGTAPISVATGTTTPAISISAATTGAAGSMSAADKTKLDGIATGATANTGTVTSVSVTTNNGISGTVATNTTTPAITLSIGALTNATSVTMNGSTSGTVQLIPTAAAGTGTVLTLPATTGTLALTSQLTTGTVASVSVVSANGFAGSVATSTTTPAITISTSITGLLKGNGTSIAAATAGTDYVAPATATTFTATQNFPFAGITLKGASTGFTTFNSGNSSATNYTITFPAVSGTVLTTGTIVQVSEGGTGAGLLTGLVKGNGTSPFTVATAGTDYLAPPGGTSLLKANNGGALAGANAGTDYVTPTGTETLTNKTITGTKETRVAMGANNIDLSVGNYFTKTISGATTLTVSNVPSSGTAQCFILDLTNGGSAAITWWTVKWTGGTAPTLTAAGRDVLGFFTHDGGTTWTGLVLGKDVK